MARLRVVGVREETEAERAMAEWFDKQALASPDTLEAAARTVVGLVTGLLALLLGVLSLSDDPLPSYLWDTAVRPLGVAAIVCLFIALLCALLVVLPRRIAVSRSQQKEAFDRMLARKARWLRATVAAFAVGMGLLGAILIVALLGVV